MGAGILKISKHERAKRKKKDETKSEYQNDWRQAKICKKVGEMVLKNERDRIVESERG